MATQRQKKNRFFKNLEYRFYCRNGYLPDRHEEFEVFGHKHSREFAVLRLQSTKYLRNQFPEIAYAFDGEYEYLESIATKFPFMSSLSDEGKEQFFQDIVSGKFDWNDIDVKRAASYLLAKKYYYYRSDNIDYSVSPVKLRDYERDWMRRGSDAEQIILRRLSKDGNPFYNVGGYVDIEIPMSMCTRDENGKVKYFTIANTTSNGSYVNYNLRIKKNGEVKRLTVTGRQILFSLRESIGEYLRGEVKANDGDYYFDYTRIIPIGDNRGLYSVDVDGRGYRDREKIALLEEALQRIEDPILRSNLAYGWEGVVTDCKEWLSKKSKVDIAKKLGRFDGIYMAPLSGQRLYPTNLTSMSTPTMINRSYDKLNYNMFMLDSSFEFYGRGQIEIDEDGNLLFVHYEKEDTKNLYWDEVPYDLRREEKFGQLVSRERSVPLIRAVDEYQGRSVDKVHLKPHEYGYKDRTVFEDSGYEESRVQITDGIARLKSIVGEGKYLVPAFGDELQRLIDAHHAGTISEDENRRMLELMKEYYDTLLVDREKERYWYVEVDKLSEEMDYDHIDYATKKLFDLLLTDFDLFVENGTLYSEDGAEAERNKYYRPTRSYKVVDEKSIKIIKDTIYRKHMLRAEGKYPVAALDEPEKNKKKKV